MSDVNAITGVIGGSGASSSSSSSAGLADDFDTFLLLLTTQLQNQDPSEPLDTGEFTSQLVEFASVEQTIKQTDLLEEIAATNGKNDFLAAASLVGKDVEVFGNQLNISEGEENISKSLVYAHAVNVSDTKITVYDNNNSVVYTAEGETAPGKHTFTWDGTNLSGETVPAGAYTVTMEFTPKGSAELKPMATNIVDRVDEILLVDDEIFVSLEGSFTVPFEDILAVSEHNDI
jgi:flagellar basal-body rod modification protein FlgD